LFLFLGIPSSSIVTRSSFIKSAKLSPCRYFWNCLCAV
jgi:hypothetical protein